MTEILSGAVVAAAAEYLTKTQYIILLSACAGGVLVLLSAVLAVRLARYRKKMRAYRAALDAAPAAAAGPNCSVQTAPAASRSLTPAKTSGWQSRSRRRR